MVFLSASRPSDDQLALGNSPSSRPKHVNDIYALWTGTGHMPSWWICRTSSLSEAAGWWQLLVKNASESLDV